MIRTAKQLWQSVSMAAFLGSLLTALMFHGDMPDETAFIWTMGVFAGSLLISLPFLVLLSVPFMEAIKALSRRYDRHLFLASVIGGACGAALVLALLLLTVTAIPDLKPSGSISNTAPRVGKLLMSGYAYGMSLALFIGLNQRPAERRKTHPPR